MARKITIGGKELTLACNMHAIISYERITGESALDLTKFQDGSIVPIAKLGYCMLLGSNKEEDIPNEEAMMSDMDTYEKMNEFIKAVSQEIIDFFTPDKSPKPEKTEPAKNS